MKITGSILLICFTLSSVTAQESTEDMRDASPNGPFPIYVDLSYVRSSSMEDFKKFSDLIDSDDRKIMRGFEANIGVAIHEDRPFFLKNLYLEFGYKKLYRNPSNTVKYKKEFFTGAVGCRWTIFYPLTAHFRLGPIIRVSDNFDFDGVLENRKINIAYNSFKKDKPLFPGWHGKVKLMFLDPIGTSGGIGYFIQWQFFYIDSAFRPNYNDFLEPPLPQSNIKVDGFFSTTSLGVVIPFTIRVR